MIYPYFWRKEYYGIIILQFVQKEVKTYKKFIKMIEIENIRSLRIT